jgi:hypothetical protein
MKTTPIEDELMLAQLDAAVSAIARFMDTFEPERLSLEEAEYLLGEFNRLERLGSIGLALTSPTGGRVQTPKVVARELIAAIDDTAHGVLEWLKQH